MLEKVARAIFRQKFDKDEYTHRIERCWNEWAEERALCERQARAAIEAMREPSPAMVEAAQAKMFYDDETAVPDMLRAAMTAALGETDE